MKLYDFYKKRFIAGFHPKELRLALNREHPEISGMILGNGSILFTNEKLLKCVSNYYESVSTDNVIQNKMTKSNVYLKCDMVQECLGLSHWKIRCDKCHLECMKKLENNELRRK